MRIRTWRVPPRWSYSDWCDEARAQGEAAVCDGLRDFNPRRLVPLDAFLFHRVVQAVWTRYRQECSFGRRTRSGEAILDRPAAEGTKPDADTLARLEAALGSLDAVDRDLIRQLFWDDRCESDLAREWGVSRQAVSKRKQKILRELRRQMGMP
jgi:DNA-directed RNA polymerase specialized sigma24 family protein